MIFRCKLCRKVKVWKESKCYRVMATSNEDVITTIKICEPCGDEINKQYESGQVIADMEVVEINE